MSDLIPFSFESKSIRVLSLGGAPWFVAADLCKTLGLSDHKGSYSHHLNKLDEDERAAIPRSIVQGTPTSNMGVVAKAFVEAAGGAVWAEPEIWIVSESGAYSLILRSRDATTPGTVQHRFKRWVTSEVIPSIRRTGEYRVNPIHTPSDDLARVRAQRDLLWSWLIELKPEVGKIARYRTAGLTQIEVARALAWGVKRVRKAEKRLDGVGLLPKRESMQLTLLEG